MKSFLQTSLYRHWVHQTQCLNNINVRYMGHSTEGYAFALAKDALEPGKPPSFEALGLRPPIVASLQAAFPNVKHPTETQAQFIPAVLSGKDLLLKDETGSGKSFGLILALLSKPRLRFKDQVTGKPPEKPSITSLVIVPHRDLAYQLLHWIQRMTNNHVVHSPPPPISSIAQVMVRDGITHLTSRLSTLRQVPPHILIGTPQALMDVAREDPDALQLSSLSSVVVDEVDYLIETVPKKDPNKSFQQAFVKANKKVQKHPGVTRDLLDVIYATRKEANGRTCDEAGVSQPRRCRALFNASHTPQLILSSATLRNHLNNYLFDESGWLNKENLTKVKGAKLISQTSTRVSPLGVRDQLKTNDGLGGTDLSHSVLVVSRDGIENITSAVQVEEDMPYREGRQTISPETIFASPIVLEVPDIDRRLVEKYANSPSPFKPNVIEAIATAFALDVPAIALLVLPSSAPLQRAVYELREMGVDAYGLDLLADDKGRAHLLSGGGVVQANPTLLVSTLSTTRGLDLPELTHVFILGIPLGPKVNGRTIDAYLHIAGRVGRFGRGGKVITVVEKGEASQKGEGVKDEGTTGVTEAAKMLRIFKGIHVTPVQFEHFD